MEEKVFVLGHQNPDTDSICSAIAYAFFKRQYDIDAVPVRIGRVNRETAFVLDYFGVEEPEYIATVKTQVLNLDMDSIVPVSPEISLKEAWKILSDKKMGVLPVTDGGQKLCGVVSVSDIANAYMNMPEGNILAASLTPFENIVRTLNAKLIYNSGRPLSESANVVVAAMKPDGMKAHMRRGDIVLVGDREENQKKAVETGAFCIIATCGSKIDRDVMKSAENNGCSLMTTEYDTFTAARLLYQSIPVSFLMTSDNLVCFRQDDYVDEIREKMMNTRFRSYPVVDRAGHFLGFVSRYHLIGRHRKKVILVDHSERSQTINGIEEAEILEIIDHHRIGGIETGSPIYYRNEPVGSTATIVAGLFFENNIEIPGKIAGILCAAILSDTVMFKSPTSTEADAAAVKRLSAICGVDPESFAAQMFKAGSSLKNMRPDEILQSDFKEYSIGDTNVGIGQVNTSDLQSAKKLRAPVLKYMDKLIANGKLDVVMLIITDIVNEETEVLFVETRKGLVASAFNPLIDENSFSMKGIVSRKKQIVPKLTEAILNI